MGLRHLYFFKRLHIIVMHHLKQYNDQGTSEIILKNQIILSELSNIILLLLFLMMEK